MHQPVPPALNNPINARVLAHVDSISAHSDVAEALTQCVKPLGDVHLFCPDSSQYRCLCAWTNNVVFALAAGMSVVAFRLDAIFKARALKSGAEPYPECGDEWAAFTLFRSDWPAPDLPFWARRAYVIARETGTR